MNCPNCGAPMVPRKGGDHFVCKFCSTFHFPEKSLDGVMVIGQPGSRDCPVCHVPLVSAFVSRKPVEHCTSCKGILVDRRAFNEIISALRGRHKGPRQEHQALDPEERERELRCPGCSGPMELHPYFGPGNVLMDSCYECALIWLDQGEIATIARS